MKYFHSFYLFCLRYCWLKWAPDFGRVQKTNTFVEQMNEKKNSNLLNTIHKIMNCKLYFCTTTAVGIAGYLSRVPPTLGNFNGDTATPRHLSG